MRVPFVGMVAKPLEELRMLVFPCPSCGAKLQMSDDLAGKKVRCASCQNVVMAPEKGAGDEAITAASPAAVAGGAASRRRETDDAVESPRDRGPRRDGGSTGKKVAAGVGMG